VPIRGERAACVALFTFLALACAGTPDRLVPTIYTPPPTISRPILIRAAKVFDGTGADPVAGALVVVEGETIQCVGVDCRVPLNAVTVEVPGGTMLPGLVDLHVHFYLAKGPSMGWSDGLWVLQRPALRRAFLEAGVTTIRSVGDDVVGMRALQRQMRNGDLSGPDVVAAGPILTSVNGYFASALRRVTPWVVHRWARELGDADDARREVDSVTDEGFEWIKFALVHYGRWPALDEPTVRAIVSQAHARGRRVAAHTTTEADVLLAVSAGADTIEHGAIDGLSPDTIEAMRVAHVTFVPTLHLIGTVRPEQLARQRSEVLAAHRAGVRIGVGSDILGPSGDIRKDTAEEIAALVAAGLTMSEALRAATGDAAVTLGRQDTIGYLRAGLHADIVILAGDPWTDPNALRDPAAVLQRGRIVLGPH